MAFLIGVDGGGTSCRAVIAARDGTRLGEGLAGSANILHRPDRRRDNIVEAAGLAARDAGLAESWIRERAAVLGLAGSNVGTYANRIASILPFRVSHVETDALIALEGALGEADGAVAIVGTGSPIHVAASRPDTRPSAAGASRSATRAAARASAGRCCRRRCSPMTASARHPI